MHTFCLIITLVILTKIKFFETTGGTIITTIIIIFIIVTFPSMKQLMYNVLKNYFIFLF